MFDAKTPEAAAYLAQREATQNYQLRIWRRVAIALAVALVIVISALVFVVVKVNDIRTTQLANTTVAQCQAKTFNTFLGDVRLLAAGDKKVSDYAKVPRPC